MLTRVAAFWGILHKETWESGGAPENPQEFEFDPKIGSGPFEVNSFEVGENLVLDPHDGHPVIDTDTGIFFQGFTDVQTIFESFRNNDLQMVFGLTPALAERLEEEMSDTAFVSPSQGHSPGILISPQYNIAPTKFEEFRDAIGKAINRQEVNQIAYRGTSDTTTYSELMLDPHPWSPPKDMLYQFIDDPTGDLDIARQALVDEGWGIDDDGNLRYPQDADVSPLWPEGESPTSEHGFACLDRKGNWVPPEER